MTSSAAYVFDANVLVSAAIQPNSKPRRAFDAARGQGTILLSDTLFDELHDVLARRKLDRYLSLDERAEFLSTFKREATTVNITVTIQECRDPKDDHILELAVSGGATCIVTGDDDLLALNPFRGIPIRTLAAFLVSNASPHQP